MKNFAVFALISCALFGAAQIAPKPSTPLPALEVRDKVALGAVEKQKQDASSAYNQAQANENAILQEWADAHKGYHINPATFMVEANQPVAVPAVPTPPPAKKDVPAAPAKK